MKFTVAFICAMLFATAAGAQDCALSQIAALPITTLANGAAAVPFKLDGHDVLLEIALEAPHTAINADFAHRIDADASGATLWAMEMGAYHFRDVPVAEVAASAPGTAGVLGVDTLREYDVELDFKNAQMKLFAKSHCPGNVVYWADNYTVVPFDVDASGQVVAQMTLDGKPVRVGISSAPGRELMDERGRAGPYKDLTMNAVSIANPQIEYAASTCGAGCGPDLYIRLSELKLLHLFFAFSENKLYITPQGGRKS